MNAEFDELLRDGMDRFTAELRAPANLAERARRSRRQRLTVRTAASGVAAMAVAGITFAAIPATTAPVSTGVDLHPVAERFDIEHVRVIIANKTSAQVWIYREQVRDLRTTSSGRPIEDVGSAVVKAKDGHHRSVRTIVDYHRKVWGRGPEGFSFTNPTLSCHQPNLFLPESGGALPGWIRGVHKLIKCGDLVVSGTAQVNGIQTIKLKTSPSFAAPPVTQATIWVKRSDYVPVRMVASEGKNFTTRRDLSWLRPTKANVAELRVPIPAGFRRVPLSQAGERSVSCNASSSHPHKQSCTHSG